MRNFLRLVVLAALIAAVVYVVKGGRLSFGRLEADRGLEVIVHLANCSTTAVTVGAAEQAPTSIPAWESRDVDNAFWGQGHVMRGNRLDYPAPPVPADLRHDGRAILFLQIDEQLRLHLAANSGCSAPRLSPQPKGFPVEPLAG